MKAVITVILLFFYVNGVFGQDSRFKVEEALLNIEDHYQVRFSYSKDIVPYEEEVVLAFDRKSLVEVLEDLGAQTGIIYRQRGARVVLNYDPQRKERLDQNTGIEPPTEHPETGADPPVESPESSAEYALQIEPGERNRIDSLSRLQADDPRALVSYTQRRYEAKGLTLNEGEVQWAQVSMVPTGLDRKTAKINHFSFNVLAGYTGGLRGFELGGIVNAAKRDVKGLQLSGFGNYTGGNTEGVQVAGFGNFNQGIMRGLQIGGFSNINVQADAVQIAGAFNLNRRISRGYQVAGLFNAGRNVTGGQIAGFFNLSLGSVYFQTSGFCNVAENTDIQIAGLVNVAKQVDVLQLGLINIADSVGGVSFGLLNLIKKGYNKIELSAGDALYGNLAFKLGTRRFYNIFQVGSNFKRNIQGTGLIWSYGYGFGFFQNMTRDVRFNPEILVSNVQEKRIIKPDLNLLAQVKFLFHFAEGNPFEVFAGPSLNLMISRLTLENGILVGSGIPHLTLYERDFLNLAEPFNTKWWIGFNAGIRI
jgi:hypothetical protein